jgi:hypothetical protein
VESARVAPDYFELPMRISPQLSGGFAELRANHLHSGIDFKTQKTVGIPIYAPANGWVSRIRISAFGFGYALYLDHDNGFTTVYGHLQGYADPIATAARNMQYRLERFELDTVLPKRRIPVRKGQLIAYSGNSGLSAAPHLHFEIRDTKTEETIDPLLWFHNRIPDNTPPRIHKVALFAIQGEGVLSNGARLGWVNVVRNKQGVWALAGNLPSAWGKIGLGIDANDYMNGNANPYGVCQIRLFMGETLLFQQDLSRFNFNETRYVNSLADFESWQRNRTWIMKSFLDPGNHLNVYPALHDRGYVTIDAEKTYSFRYELVDRSGNSSVLRFTVQGKKRVIPTPPSKGRKMVFWLPNFFRTNDFRLEIPAGTLYRNIDFQFQQLPDNGYSDRYVVHTTMEPLHTPIRAEFRIQRDVLNEKHQYYLALVSPLGGTRYVESRYENGFMVADLKQFGTYKVLSDSIKPKIMLRNSENIAKNNLIRVSVTDNASGIQSWRGTLDGKWMLFELDGKSGILTYRMDSSRVESGREHQLRLSVRDACRNESILETHFFW